MENDVGVRVDHWNEGLSDAFTLLSPLSKWMVVDAGVYGVQRCLLGGPRADFGQRGAYRVIGFGPVVKSLREEIK